MPESAYDCIVIGSGPGGYVAAIRAAQLGMKTAMVENDVIGGRCLNYACIPAKAVLRVADVLQEVREADDFGIRVGAPEVDFGAVTERRLRVVKTLTGGVSGLFKKHGIDVIEGHGSVTSDGNVKVGGNFDGDEIEVAKGVIIATGSVPIELPFLKFDEERVLSNTGAIAIPEVPRHLIVIGGGVIGLELGSVWRRLGAKVTVVELAPTILPGNDAEIITEADRIFRKQGLDIRVGTKVTSGRRDGDRVLVDIEKDGNAETLEADYVLVSVGRKPSLNGIDAAGLGLALGKRGEITADAEMRTNLPNVFAIGDAVGGKLLAHKAEEEGVIAAEVIAGHKVHMDYRSMPSVVYTWPEIATVGLAEYEVKESGREYKTGKFPFSANGRARTMAETNGFVKFIADAKTDELLGCHIIGANASDLLQEVVLAFEYRGSSEDIGITVHSHPTLSETVKEAALAVLGRAIHM